jgi:hypothetical protein
MKKNSISKKGKFSPAKDSGDLRKPTKLQPVRNKIVKKTSNPALFSDDDEMDDFDADALRGFDDFEGGVADDEEEM